MRSALTITVILSLLLPNLSYADMPGCNQSTYAPCPSIRADRKQDGQQASNLCLAIEADDRSCNAEFEMMAAYAVMAGICAWACFSDWGIGPISKTCTYGSLVLGLADLYYSARVANQNNDIDRAGGAIARNYGLAAPAAGLIAQATFNLGPRLGGYFALNIGKSAAQNAAGEAASKAAETAQGSYSDKIAQMQQAGEQAGKNSQTHTVSCISAIINGAMGGWKLADYAIIRNHSDKVYHDMLCSISTCDKNAGTSTGPVSPQSISPSSFISQNSGNAPTVTTPPGTTDDVKAAGDKLFNSGKMAENYAKGELGQANGVKPDDFQKAMKDFTQQTGITPGQLVAAATQGGMADMMGKLAGNSDKGRALADAMRDLDGKIRTMGSNVTFASAVSGGSGGKQGSPFGGFGNRETAAVGGTTNVSFGGFDGDIWHAGSNKTIFEIVSERTNRVANRVQ